MKSILEAVQKTLESSFKCSECFEDIENGKVESHFQYCSHCSFFEETSVYLTNIAGPAVRNFCQSLARKMMIFKANLKERRRNLTEGDNSESIKKIISQELKLKKRIIYYKILLRIFRFSAQDLKHFEFFLLFANENYSFSLKDSDFFGALFSGKSIIRNRFSTQLFFERELSVRVDSKLWMNNCWYTEDGEFLAISDSERIYIYDVKTNKFISKVTGNRSPKTALVGKFKYLIFQDHEYDIVVYNFKNGIQEYKITEFPKVAINYFKVSENSQYLICKFYPGQILIWNLLSREKIQYFSDKPDWNFVICFKNTEIILFNSKIEAFDINTGIKTRKILKNYSTIEYLALINDEKLVYADNKKLQIFNYKTLTVIQNFPGYSDLFFLSKKFDMISSLSGKALEIDSDLIKITNFRKDYLKENPLNAFPFSAPHIFCKKYNDNNTPKNDLILTQLIKNNNFINQEQFIEKLVFNSGKLFVIYYNKKRLVVYIWDCLGKEKKLEIKDFSGKWACRFICHDYLILEDKNFHHFFDFNTRSVDRYAQLDFYDSNFKENLTIEQFSIMKSRKFTVFISKDSNHFMVIKISDFNNITPSACMPVLDNLQKFIGTVFQDEIRIIDIERNKIQFRIEIKQENHIFKGFYIINSRFVCLVSSKKMKLFDLITNSFVFKTKLKIITDIKELNIQVFQDLIIYENDSNVFVIFLNKIIKKCEFSVEDLLESEISLKEDLGLLIIVGRLNPGSSNSEISTESSLPQYICTVIELSAQSLLKKLTKIVENPAKLVKNFLIFFNSCKISFYNLSTNLPESEFSIPPYEIDQVIIEKSFICLQHSNKISIFKVSSAIEHLEIPMIQISSFMPSECETFVGILNDYQLILYEFTSGAKISEYSYQFSGYSKFFILRNKFIVITGQHLRIILLKIENNLIKLARFKFKNERLEDFKVKLTDDLMIQLIGKVNYVLFNPLKKTKVMKIGFKDFRTDPSFQYAIIKDVNGFAKVMNLLSSNSRMLLAENENLVFGDFIEKHQKFIVYDPMEDMAYLESALSRFTK